MSRQLLVMAKRIEKGDTAVIRAKIDKVWENGLVTLHLPGYEHPVTVHEQYLEEIIRGPEAPREPKVKDREKPLYDERT